MSDLPTDANPYAKFKPAQSAPQSDNPYAKFQTAAPNPAKPSEGQPSIAQALWEGVTQVPRFIAGVAEGVGGAGVPAGRASQYQGSDAGLDAGRAGFAGRAIGAGARSIAETLWDTIKAPGQMVTGEMQPGPQGEAAARGLAMTLAGVGGFRPGMAIRPGGATMGMGGGGERPPGVQPPPPGVIGGGRVESIFGDTPVGPGGPSGVPLPIRASKVGQKPPNDIRAQLQDLADVHGFMTPEYEAARERLLGSRLQDTGPPGIPVGGGRVEPAVPGQPPVIPPGVQPPRPVGGALPPQQPGTPAPPGGRAMPETPPPAPIRPPLPSNPQADAATVSMYRQAVLPGRGQRSRAPQMDAYNQAVTTGVDEIIGNQPNLRLTALNGTALPPGSTVPRNMKQFSEAIDQSEATLFEQWNPMTSRAGERGLRIDLAPVAAELRSLAKRPEVVGVNPAVVSQMENFAGIYEGLGAVTPLEAQKIVTGINQRLSAFYAKGEAASGAPAEVLAPVAQMLRKALDEGIEAAEGPGWQDLRNRYGALRSIEKDVTKAAERLANKPSSFLGKAGNFLASREFAHAMITLNPAALARAIGTKGAVELHKIYNDPNLMIERMFRQRMQGPPPPPPSIGAPAFAVAAPIMGNRMQQGGFPQPKRDPDQPLRQPVF